VIKSIDLKNFQSHRKSSLKLSEGVNVIKGQSNSGKSSIVRALRWLLLNKPQGGAFKSVFSKPKEAVAVTVDDSRCTVTRFRDPSENGYVVGGNKLTAVRNDVPLEVSSVLNLSEINLQSQHDGYFLLQESAGEVARRFNDLAGLGIIDFSIKLANAEVLKETNALSVLKNQLANYEEQIAIYLGLDSVADEVAALAEIVDEAGSISSNIEQIEKAGDRLSELQKVAAGFLELDELLDKLGSIGALSSRIKEVTVEIEYIEGLVNRIHLHETNFAASEKECNDLAVEIDSNKQRIHKLIGSYGKCPLCGSVVQEDKE